MLTDYVKRSEWGARAPKKPTAKIQPELVRGICYHCLGSRAALSPGDQRARQVQAYHQDVRGARDVMYNFSGTLGGEVYEGRGFGKSSAAEGNRKLNRQWISFLLQCATTHDIDDTARQMMIEFAVDAGLVMRTFHDPLWVPEIIGHRDVRRKPCPGDKIYAVLKDPSFSSEVKLQLERVWQAQQKNPAVDARSVTKTKAPQPSKPRQSDIDYQHAIEVGLTDGSRPDDPATRREVALMALRASKLKGNG